MEPEVNLVVAHQETSGLKPKVRPPAQSYRWPGVGSRGDDKAGIGDIGVHSATSTTTTSSLISSAPPPPIYAVPGVTTKPFIPCFKASVPPKLPATAASKGLCPPAPMPTKIKPVFGAGVKTSNPVPSFGSSSSSTGPSAPSSGSGSSLPKISPQFAAMNRPAKESFFPSFGPKPKAKQGGQDAALGSLDRTLPPIPAEMMKPLFSMPKPTFAPKKEKAAKRKPVESADGSSEVTIPTAVKRPKSAVKADVDIPALASKPNGLSSVNAATLLDWCRKNGVQCRVKDKKDELVCKVLAKLSCPSVLNEP